LLPPLAVQYPDYAVWQRRWLESGVEARQLEYWKAQLAGDHPVLALPSDRPRPALQSFAGAAHTFELDPGLARQLESFGREQGLTLITTLATGLFALLGRYSGQT